MTPREDYLNVATEQAVPESISSGQRLHNLEAVKDALEPQGRAQRSAISGPAWRQRALGGQQRPARLRMDAIGAGGLGSVSV